MRAEEWLKSFEKTETLAQVISELISERNAIKRNNDTKPSARIQTQIRAKLLELSKNINFLKIQLEKETVLVTTKEADRRQNQIDLLVSKEKQLNEAFRPSVAAGFANSGFDHDLSSRRAADYGSTDDNPISPGMFRDKQAQIVEDQDKGLDKIAEILQRQKQMGRAIGDEIDYQNDIIDDISQGMQRTNQNILRTDEHVKKVNKKAGSTALLVIVVLLFIAIIVLAVY